MNVFYHRRDKLVCGFCLVLDENMKEELKDCLEEKMESQGLVFVKKSDEYLDELYMEYCRDCEIEDCGVCSTVRSEMDSFLDDCLARSEE